MLKNLATLFLFMVLSTAAWCQNSMQFLDGKNYNATQTMDFVCEDYIYDAILKVQIAKTAKGGLLKLAIKTSTKNVKISDKVLLILGNGTIIHCLDKSLNSFTDTESIGFYVLSAAEMQMLNKQHIQNIRFRVMGAQSQFGSPIGHFTANNREKNFGQIDKTKNKYDTISEIKLLK